MRKSCTPSPAGILFQNPENQIIDEANAYANYFTACHDSLDQEEINNVLVLYQRDPKRVVPEIVATVDTIVNISGKSASSLRNRLTLMRLPGEVQASLRAGEIPGT